MQMAMPCTARDVGSQGPLAHRLRRRGLWHCKGLASMDAAYLQACAWQRKKTHMVGVQGFHALCVTGLYTVSTCLACVHVCCVCILSSAVGAVAQTSRRQWRCSPT